MSFDEILAFSMYKKFLIPNSI